MNPKGHAAIVTGGASGLGGATAAALAKAGAKVAIFDINMDAAKAHAEKIGGIAIKCDVSSADGAAAAVKEAADRNGVARILVNCAGIATFAPALASAAAVAPPSPDAPPVTMAA